jgi:hypothetical protein
MTVGLLQCLAHQRSPHVVHVLIDVKALLGEAHLLDGGFIRQSAQVFRKAA